MKRFICLIIAGILVLSSMSFAFAEENVSTGKAEVITETQRVDTSAGPGHRPNPGTETGSSSESGSTSTNGSSSGNSSTKNPVVSTYSEYSPEVLMGIDGVNADIDVIGNRINEKMLGIIRLLKKSVAPVCVIVFIGCCVLCLFAAFASKGLLFKGFMGALISGLMYAAIMSAESIVVAIAAWSQI